jgi:hypothetical protein
MKAMVATINAHDPNKYRYNTGIPKSVESDDARLISG